MYPKSFIRLIALLLLEEIRIDRSEEEREA